MKISNSARDIGIFLSVFFLGLVDIISVYLMFPSS